MPLSRWICSHICRFPVLALALPFAATLERVQSEALARALKDPAVSAARARGLSRRALVWRHAWRLGAGPVVAVCGLMAGALLSGSFAVELVTSWPGLGQLTVQAMYGRDIYLSAGCAMAATLLLSFGVVTADLVSAFIDPRVLEIDHPRVGRPHEACGTSDRGSVAGCRGRRTVAGAVCAIAPVSGRCVRAADARSCMA